jgi:hypothetical protein
MPLANSSLPSELTISVLDYNNEESTTSIFLPAATDIAEIALNVAAFETVIAALTTGFITGAGLSRRFNQTDPREVLVAGGNSNVQRKGVFVFENSFGTYNKYTIPSIDRTLVLPNSDAINVTAPAVAAYVALMTAPDILPIPGARPVGGNGYQLVRLVEAYEDTVSRPNRKR